MFNRCFSFFCCKKPEQEDLDLKPLLIKPDPVPEQPYSLMIKPKEKFKKLLDTSKERHGKIVDLRNQQAKLPLDDLQGRQALQEKIDSANDACESSEKQITTRMEADREYYLRFDGKDKRSDDGLNLKINNGWKQFDDPNDNEWVEVTDEPKGRVDFRY